MKDRLIIALDVDNLNKAKSLVNRLYPAVKIFKVGNRLFTACGPKAIEMVHRKRAKVFLDLKFHDIPNTVASAVRAAKAMGVFMLNLHASGGRDMMEAAVSAKGKGEPLLLAVTVLTSLDAGSLKDVGINSSAREQVKRLAILARRAGLDGVVCSPQEISVVRRACGKDFIIVTPGIRPAESAKQDQKRIATAGYAVREGADYIVVGRPITEAGDPLIAAVSILKEAGQQYEQ